MYTDCYQQRDKPFSKVNNRKKTTLSISFFLSHSLALSQSLLWISIFFFIFHSVKVDRHLFVFLVIFFPESVCRSNGMFRSTDRWICLWTLFGFVRRRFFSISQWHVLSIWLEMSKTFQFFFPTVTRFGLSNKHTHSNEIEPAHIDTVAWNSLGLNEKTKSFHELYNSKLFTAWNDYFDIDQHQNCSW